MLEQNKKIENDKFPELSKPIEKPINDITINNTENKKIIEEKNNNIEKKHPGGRPLKFQSIKELEDKINDYFDSCYETKWKDVYKRDKDGNRIKDDSGKYEKKAIQVKEIIRPFTITGLAVALDTSRETLLNYEDRKEFFDTIKRAKEKIHNFTEEKLFGNNATGVIFNLKNNYDWKDKSALELSDPNGKPLPPVTIEIIKPKNEKINTTEEHKGNSSISEESGKPEKDKSE
jgi:hypothetical protein